MPDPEDIRTEYAAIADYHESTVSTRFTIAGLYLAAVGFIASALLDKDATWVARAVGSLLAWWFTGCMWLLELRSRALYTNVSRRGIEIEHRQWGLVGDQWYTGFFSRQYKREPDEADAVGPKPPGFDCPKIAWMRQPLSEGLSRYISHSWAFDLLYSGSWVFWTIALLTAAFHLVRSFVRPCWLP